MKNPLLLPQMPTSPESMAAAAAGKENGTSSSPQTTTDQTRFTLIYEGEEVRNGNEEAFWRGGGRMVSDCGRENEEMVKGGRADGFCLEEGGGACLVGCNKGGL